MAAEINPDSAGRRIVSSVEMRRATEKQRQAAYSNPLKETYSFKKFYHSLIRRLLSAIPLKGSKFPRAKP
jgi:hypothetical protein